MNKRKHDTPTETKYIKKIIEITPHTLGEEFFTSSHNRRPSSPEVFQIAPAESPSS